MIAKRIGRQKATSDFARLTRYVVDAKGQVDPLTWTRTASYILDEKGGGAKVGGVRVTNCGTDDPAMAAIAVMATQARNTRSRADKSYHLVFSFAPGERPPLAVLHAIEDVLCNEIGYGNHQRISAVHTDTANLHVHVAINKIDPKTFRAVEPFYDKARLMEACVRLEERFGLVRTNHGQIITKEERHVAKRAERGERRRSGQRGRNERAGDRPAREPYPRPDSGPAAAKTLNGLRTLSGVGLVRDAGLGQVLLPSHAPGQLVDGRTERADGVRRPGVGGGNGGPLSRAAADIEAKSGRESLLRHARAHVPSALEGASTWSELHAALALAGLRLERGRFGGVIRSDDSRSAVPLTAASRGVTLDALGKKLGAFEAAPARPKVATRRAGSVVGSSALYAQWQAEQSAVRAQRALRVAAVAEEAAAYYGGLREHYAGRRAVVARAVMPGQRRDAYLALATEREADGKAARARFAERRASAREATPAVSWIAWLIKRAESGDAEALATLRRRGDRERDLFGNCIGGRERAGVAAALRRDLRPQVRGDGCALYTVSDGGRVEDAAGAVRVARGSANADALALLLAMERFGGKPLEIDGSAAFRTRMARLAGTMGLAVTFADPAMEAERARTTSTGDKRPPPAVPIVSPTPTPREPIAAPDRESAASVYVDERNAMRTRVQGVLVHREWTPSDAGDATFRGVRAIRGESVALLERDGMMLVKAIDATELRAWSGKRRGAAVSLDQSGGTRWGGRSKGR